MLSSSSILTSSILSFDFTWDGTWGGTACTEQEPTAMPIDGDSDGGGDGSPGQIHPPNNAIAMGLGHEKR